MKVMGRPADRIACRLPGHEHGVVKIGLDQDDPPRLPAVGRFSRDERSPRKEGWFSVDDPLERIGERSERSTEVFELGFTMSYALTRSGEALHDATKARIRGQGSEERLGRNELIHGRRNLGGGQEEQTVTLEGWTTVGSPY